MNPTIYKPGARAEINIFRTIYTIFKNGIENRELIYQLFKRDFIMMYKKSFLGVGWHLAAPLVAMGAWLFLNSSGILDPGETVVPYPVFVLVGITFWSFFTNLFQNCIKTLTLARGFITQVNFPHEVLFFKQIFQQVVNFSISFILVIAILIIFQVVPHWKAVFFPLMLLPLIFFTGAIGLLLSIFEVASQDVSKFFEVFLSFLLFITPIAYSLEKVPDNLEFIIVYNPLTYLIGEMRNVFLYGKLNMPFEYMITAVVSLLVFIVSLRLFFISEEKIMEKLN